MIEHRFGGPWTDRKLRALQEYLKQYRLIFARNPRAQTFRTVYVDAFAGTGERDVAVSGEIGLFGYTNETRDFQDGSVRIALSLDSPFDEYIFIDHKPSHVGALSETVQREFPTLWDRCTVQCADANVWIRDWCATQSWVNKRAVVFLDPYGMNVEWKTILAIAGTKAIDLWVLFPYALGANRMLPTDVLPESGWAMRLTRVFGTNDWLKAFYARDSTGDLFDQSRHAVVKTADPDRILAFYLDRLRSVFPHVVANPMVLYNSQRSPMYALCFAAGNPKGGKTALKIAAHLARTR
jgi:three-Cys-motif partner protein